MATYPWHNSRDPFHVFVAEYLLRRTTRKVVARVFPRIIDRFPSPDLLGNAPADELLQLARELGLKQRTLQLIEASKRIAQHGGLERGTRFLMALPSVGPYIVDAVLLYGFGVRRFPLDANAQRVIHRVNVDTRGQATREPYQDQDLVSIVRILTRGLDAYELRQLHQGLLRVAWETCRATPRCPQCLLRDVCRYGKQSARHSRRPVRSRRSATRGVANDRIVFTEAALADGPRRSDTDRR